MDLQPPIAHTEKIEIKLTNKEAYLILDAKSYRAILENKYFKAIQLLDHLRAHSSGYAFFQRLKSVRGVVSSETIYIHKYLAEHFVDKPLVKSGKKVYVHFKNKNPLDCRLENLEWITMNQLRRNQKNVGGDTGFRGVVREGPSRFKAIIYDEGKPLLIGTFKTALAAAKAYNKRSLEMFGNTASLNDLTPKR